jgi:hypothetical protein
MSWVSKALKKVDKKILRPVGSTTKKVVATQFGMVTGGLVKPDVIGLKNKSYAKYTKLGQMIDIGAVAIGGGYLASGYLGAGTAAAGAAGNVPAAGAATAGSAGVSLSGYALKGLPSVANFAAQELLGDSGNAPAVTAPAGEGNLPEGVEASAATARSRVMLLGGIVLTLVFLVLFLKRKSP